MRLQLGTRLPAHACVFVLHQMAWHHSGGGVGGVKGTGGTGRSLIHPASLHGLF